MGGRTVELIDIATSVELSLVPLRNSGIGGLVQPNMPQEEGVEVEHEQPDP